VGSARQGDAETGRGTRQRHGAGQGHRVVGLTHEHGAGDTAHAVVEGVSFGLLDGFAALDKSVRSSVSELTLVGGGARSAYWARTLATLLQRPLVVREGSETAGALGAARLAWLTESGDEEQVCRVAPERRRFEPDASAFDALQPRYEKFRKLYPALRTLFS